MLHLTKQSIREPCIDPKLKSCIARASSSELVRLRHVAYMLAEPVGAGQGFRSSAVQKTGLSVSSVIMSDAKWLEVETIVSIEVLGVPSTAR